ncbi:UBP1-associated protein 2A-like [Impatiens glandulifera]|uniref:UBP1-associated protein 2A-like n=1 Tax=Impatiens glandulifera TaxID=253017 RepID=UPI001FB12C06|nr:UBP1-associated protein 2A-like [Impatiens glandulifera]
MEEPSEVGTQNVSEDGEEDNEEEGNENGGRMKKGEEEESDKELEEEPIEKILEPLGKFKLIALVKEVVSKFPDIIECVQRFADLDPAHRNIFVHGLDYDSNRETLIIVFSKYGEIESCEVVYNNVGMSKGYGFILFKHRSGASKALKHPQKKIDNRLISCHLASAGPVPAPPPVDYSSSDYNQRKIFVRNVSCDIDPLKLTEFFARYGEIEDGPLGINKHTGKFKGFCFFVYKSIESYRKALEEPNKIFEGKILHCCKHVPKSNKPNQRLSGPTPDHLIAPFRPALGFNPAVAAPTLVLGPSVGQTLDALLASQGVGLGLTMNQGMPPMMNNPGYGNLVGASYDGSQPAYIYQDGYQDPHLGQGSTWPASSGASYTDHGQ